jgi:hypothetical protein
MQNNKRRLIGRDSSGAVRTVVAAVTRRLTETIMDLVLMVCLVASPETCREERVLVGAPLADARMCMSGAVPVIAEWCEDHPDWRVQRWRCGSPRKSA